MIKSQGRLPFRGVVCRKNADQTATDFTAGVNLTWDEENFDTDGLHDKVTNNHLIVIPAHLVGSTVEIGCSLYATNLSGSNSPILHLRKNGSAIAGSQGHNPGTAWGITMTSEPIVVALNDNFSAFYQVTGDTSTDILSARSKFWLKVLN